MYERILLPTDGSKATDAAVERALDLAATYDAELHVIYVVDTAAVPTEVAADSILESLEEAGERVVADVEERAADAGVETVVAAVEYGTPHRVIREYADDNDVDLIVMGTHGRTGLDRYLLGSVTEKVVRTADVPVLTVRMPHED